MSADGKEDGLASFAGFKLAVQKFKADHPEAKRLRSVRTDGAVAFAGVEFTVGLATMDESDALPVGCQHIGCPGKNKNSIDAHFAKGGQAVDRIVNSGKHDVNSERALAQVPATTVSHQRSFTLAFTSTCHFVG